MSTTTRIEVGDGSQTAEVRREARKIAESIGFDATRAERVAIVATEVSTNLWKHAKGGEVLLTAFENGAGGMSILGLDRGPGMENLSHCMEDGFSTSGSAGQGLGAIVRLSDRADFYSVPSKGSAVLARWDAELAAPARKSAGSVVVGGINVSKPGQDVSGDSWGYSSADGRTTILVADGLGHGADARVASKEAVRIFLGNPEMPLRALIERVHQALRSTRGAAVAVARIDEGRQVVTYAGAGNIAGHIQTPLGATHHMVSGNGTAGHQMDKLQEFTYPWSEYSILVMHSDGLSTSTGIAKSYTGLSAHTPAIIAGVLYRDFKRGYDDATVIVAKAA